ncbi:MAG: energy transducer TonB, partial [Bacteroidota bacterium]
WDQSDLQRRLVYPAEAEANNIEGRVIVHLLVDRNGVVRDTEIDYSNSPILAAAAIEASINTHFTPAKTHGVSLAAWVEVPVTFRKAGR